MTHSKELKEQELLKEVNSLFPGWSIAGHPYTDDSSVHHEHFHLTYSARYNDYNISSNIYIDDGDFLKGYSDVSATDALNNLKKQIKEQLDILQSIYDSMG